MTEKTIKQFVGEFKAAFGGLEYIAINNQTGQEIKSDGWVDQPKPRLEITGSDFIKLGKQNMHHDMPASGALSGLFEIVKRG